MQTSELIFTWKSVIIAEAETMEIVISYFRGRNKGDCDEQFGVQAVLALSYELKGNTEHKSVFIVDCRKGIAETRLQPCQKPELRLSKLSAQAAC